MGTKAKILHNPRCTKSREALNYLEEKGVEIEVVEYLKNGISKEELAEFIASTGSDVSEVLRKTEKDFQEHVKGNDLNKDELLEMMIQYPKLIQRPIVVVDGKGVIARPFELIDTIL